MLNLTDDEWAAYQFDCAVIALGQYVTAQVQAAASTRSPKSVMQVLNELGGEPKARFRTLAGQATKVDKLPWE